MSALPTLRRELVGAFAVVFTGALFVVVAGLVLVVPRLTPGFAAAYVVTLLIADVALFSWFGTVLLRRRLLAPLEDMITRIEAISRGELDTRLAPGGTRETARLAAAVNQMAAHLIADQEMLAENIRSLNDTNRLLTEARDAMVRTEKLASVGRLGAGIAHEVGNPLGAVMNYLALLARNAEPARLELIRAAEREAQRIDRIIRGLLDFARPREAVAQPIDVNRVARDTIELVQTQGHFAGIALDVELTDSPAVVSGDPYQLQQVLVNLFVNAADALAVTPSPAISVRSVRRGVREAPAHRPARRAGDPPGVDYSHRRRLAAMPRYPADDPVTESGDVVEITVVDNGPGLPSELIDQVFEPFVTTKEPGKGTGLGLAVCARVIEAMGGTIHADNTDAGGAVFRLILPALHAEVVAI